VAAIARLAKALRVAGNRIQRGGQAPSPARFAGLCRDEPQHALAGPDRCLETEENFEHAFAGAPDDPGRGPIGRDPEVGGRKLIEGTDERIDHRVSR
jgi:hypothetical protein